MLIQEPRAIAIDQILSVISDGVTPKEIRPGLYEIFHFGSSHFLVDYEHYPETTVGPFGVCDSVEQLLTACPELEAPGRDFVVTFNRVSRADQPPDGGWRWHKWGGYIGHQNPQHEYIYDDTHIDEVLCFHIYEKVK